MTYHARADETAEWLNYLQPEGLVVGPKGFHRKSVRRFVASCDAAVIISCEAQPRLYIAAASVAVLKRRNVVIVETRSEVEADWIDLVRSIAPDIRMLIGTVSPPTEARH